MKSAGWEEQPSITTLCFLAGLLSDELIWSDVARRLQVPIPIRFFAFPAFSSISAMAEHVLETVPGRLLLVGHSMGGRVALEAFRQSPRRVLGLALFNTGVHPRREGEVESRGRLVELGKSQGMEAVAKDWLPPMMGSSAERRAELMPLLLDMVRRATPQSFEAQIKALLDRPDAEPLLSSIEVPTLLASGSEDTWSSPAQHLEMLRHLRAGLYVTIEDAGHMAPLEQPAATAAAVQHWIRTVNKK